MDHERSAHQGAPASTDAAGSVPVEPEGVPEAGGADGLRVTRDSIVLVVQEVLAEPFPGAVVQGGVRVLVIVDSRLYIIEIHWLEQITRLEPSRMRGQRSSIVASGNLPGYVAG